MFVSDFFSFNEEQHDLMCSMGVFDALLDKDSNFFINIIRLKESTIPEFIEAYHHINSFFSDIATLLDAAENPTMKDKLYRSARSRFHFHEVNGINLGFSKSRYGSGWGDELSNKVLSDAYQIIKKGSKQPEIFHLVSLFEEDVGPDRLSDMIATIIEPEIIKYSIRVMNELSITREAYPAMRFNANGLVINPYKKVPIMLLPEEILHEIPIARGWDDVDRVITENRIIRQEINAEIGSGWQSWASAQKKQYLRENIFMHPDVCERVITGYRDQEVERFNVKEDVSYLVELIFNRIKKRVDFKDSAKAPSSLEAARRIVAIFKQWTENNRGWAEIQEAPDNKREKAVQRFMHLGAQYYVEVNNLDLSFEPNEGRGPVDIKLSRGFDRTLVEIKLSSNGQYLHGYESQIEEYGLAEKTRNLIYVFVDVGNPIRKQKIIDLRNATIASGRPCPELIIIDATPKKAASTYHSSAVDNDMLSLDNLLDIDLGGIPELNLDDFPTTDLDIDIGDINITDLDDKE